MDLPGGGRLPLLSGGLRDLPARQQTMRDAIAWSVDLLDSAERELLQRLAVFVGGFTLEAAEAVGSRMSDVESGSFGRSSDFRLSTFDSVLDLLASLVAKSLVRYEGDPGGTPRYGMLETIREFALERLAASGDAGQMRQRHADWQLDLAERAHPHLKGAGAAHWVDALERDHANLRAALAWLVERQDGVRLVRLTGALWPFWQEHAHYGEGRRWLAAALALGDATPVQDRLRVLTGAGTLAWYQADVDHSRQMCEQALALAREIGDREAEAYQLGNLAVHASELGDNELAVTRYEESLAVAREHGSPEPVVLALHNLAIEDWARDDFASALGREEEALALAREHSMGWALPFVLAGLGSTALDLGDSARAVGCYQESIALAEVRGNVGDVIDALEGMARVAGVLGHAADAAQVFGATAVMREALPYPRSPGEAGRFESVMSGLRETLGADGFAAAWAEGQALSQEETIAAALAVRAEPAAETPTAGGRALPHGLTERELEVLRLLAAGRSNREIGDALFISPTTAARHVANIYTKLDVDSRAAATAFAHQQGLV
jgi:DNA-binding CsgD family transcriptional regulator/tetratricopeptide (TPR) repeat protein